MMGIADCQMPICDWLSYQLDLDLTIGNRQSAIGK